MSEMDRSRPITGGLMTVAVAVLAAAITGCGGAAPEILFADAQLFLVNDRTTGRVGESLRLYVAVSDADGVEDLSLLSVIHDESELYWQASSDEWVVVEQDGDSWLGLPDLRPPTGSAFPRGRYRLILEDKALQEVEGDFSITALPLDPADVQFPSLEVNGDELRILSDAEVVVRIYTRAGQIALNREVTPGVLDAATLREIPREAGLQVYLSTPPGQPVRLLSGPFALDL